MGTSKRSLIILLVISSCALQAQNDTDCGLSPQASELAQLIQSSSEQMRKDLICHPLLAQAAAVKARMMAKEGRVNHVVNYQTPNQLVRQMGFHLPPLYEAVGNQIEAISGGMKTADQTLKYFFTSPDHKAHLMGENSFYMSQNKIGVGYYYDFHTPHEHYWVVLISAEHN